MLDIPVVLIIFNRPNLVRQQIDRLRQIAPSQLYVVADGPREDRQDEKEKCLEARQAIDKVDWECSITRDYSDKNMGCASRIVSGLDAVFSKYERAIILEDDCFAEPAFFDFCKELLDKYSNTEQVMQVCGTNLVKDNHSPNASYRFSRHVVCWGWATWARAWKSNDLEMTLADDKIHSVLKRNLNNDIAVSHWKWLISRVRKRELDAWDYPWQLSVWRDEGISILPNFNLVSNKGFGEDATHTKNPDAKLANINTENMSFPLVHPKDLSFDERMDAKFVHEILVTGNKKKKGWRKKLKSRISRLLGLS